MQTLKNLSLSKKYGVAFGNVDDEMLRWHIKWACEHGVFDDLEDDDDDEL